MQEGKILRDYDAASKEKLSLQHIYEYGLNRYLFRLQLKGEISSLNLIPNHPSVIGVAHS